MVVSFKKLIYKGVFLVVKHSSAFLCSDDHFTKCVSTIGEETFIVLEYTSGISKVVIGTFIVLDGPTKAIEGIIVLIEGHTPVGIVLGFSCPMDVPPKPPDMVAASKASIHDDHF